jgi:hypothetical protein
MNEKRKSRVGWQTAHGKGISVDNHILIVKVCGKRIKVDLERVGDIFGGLLMGVLILVMSIIIPILLGGY